MAAAWAGAVARPRPAATIRAAALGMVYLRIFVIYRDSHRGKVDVTDNNRNANNKFFKCQHQIAYRKFGLKPRRFTTALSYNGKSDNQAKN
jgi:hypothetical protein